jgi:hypothetical protein
MSYRIRAGRRWDGRPTLVAVAETAAGALEIAKAAAQRHGDDDVMVFDDIATGYSISDFEAAVVRARRHAPTTFR